MENRIENLIGNALQSHGFEKRNKFSFTGSSDEIANITILVYQHPTANEFKLEIQAMYYQKMNPNSVPNVFASLLTVCIAGTTNGHRTLNASEFLLMNCTDEQLNAQIQKLLEIPVAAYLNAISPMGKFLRIIPEKLFGYLTPRDVANLELACTLLYNTSCGTIIDNTFWKLYHTKEYSMYSLRVDGNTNQNQRPVNGYRRNYLQIKNNEMNFRRQQAIPIPQVLAPEPEIIRPLPNNPLQPFNPFPSSRRPRVPFIGDVDNPDNWLPGRWHDNDTGFGGPTLPGRYAPQGDLPEHLPNNPMRGIDPDMPIGPRVPQRGERNPFGRHPGTSGGWASGSGSGFGGFI